MVVQITAACDRSAGLWSTDAKGSVYSVYRNTINLLFQDQLWALQSSLSPLSPISLQTELSPLAMSALSVRPGDACALSGGALYLFSDGECCRFHPSFSNLTTTRLTPVSGSPAQCAHAAAQLFRRTSAALSSTNRGGLSLLFATGDPPCADPFLSIAQTAVQQSVHFCQAQDWSACTQSLLSLLGLGIGLTPSGDDFLCGFLAGLAWAGAWEHPLCISLRRGISLHLSDTNVISAAFLRCAADGNFSVPLLQFLSAVHHPVALARAAEALAQVGHSSGMDSLAGLHFSAMLMRDSHFFSRSCDLL